jgi:hypothetical protein
MPNDQGHGHFHGIVHDNVTIFGKKVPLAMPNNSAKSSFQMLSTKKVFSFLMCKKMGFFF